MSERNKVTVVIAAQRTGLTPYTVRQCIEWGMVSAELAEADLAQLRRIRRLVELGINPAGVDIILRMRQRIERLQADLRQLEAHITWVSRATQEPPAALPRSQEREL